MEGKSVLFVFLWVFQCHIYRVPRDDEVINVEFVQKQSNIEKKLQESITMPLIISMTQIKFFRQEIHLHQSLRRVENVNMIKNYSRYYAVNANIIRHIIHKSSSNF